MRNIAVFGASGTTGACVVRAAIEKGLSVQALLPDPAKLPEDLKDKVRVVKGDVLNVEDVSNTLSGQDAVVVALGTNNSSTGPTTVMSEGLKNILAVMDSQSIQVISVCLSMYLFVGAESVPEEAREVTADHRRMLRALEDYDLHWVAVNPPTITHDPPSGYTSRRGQNTMYSTISKEDLGQFLVDCLSMPELYQKSVGVASLPRR